VSEAQRNAPAETPASTCTLVHLQLDVRRFLRLAKPEDYQRTFVGPNGESIHWFNAKQLLQAELALGHNYLPVGEACDAFDYVTGCAGHPI
jgi:hypothetical protein